jgi:hypothetical protein
MDDIATAPPLASPPPRPTPRRRRRWGLIAFLVLIVIPAAGLALYTWSALHFVYSRGEHAGYVQKIARRGWVCKTWEGEIAMATMPGVIPQLWDFTITSDSIARIITRADIGKRVILGYEQHVGLPTKCFGETQYFVTQVRIVDQP